MPDEYGGIEVAEPNTDEFGGVAVEEAPETSFAPVRQVRPPPSTFDRALRFLRPGIMPPAGLAIGATLQPAQVQRVERGIYAPVQKAGEVAEEAFLPAVSQRLREMGIDPSSSPERVINLPRLTEKDFPGSPAPGIAAGLQNLTAGTTESLVQSGPLLLAGTGEGAVARIAAGVFASQQFGQLPDQIQEAVRVLADPKSTKAEKVEAIGKPGVSALMAAGGAHAALRPMPETAIGALRRHLEVPPRVLPSVPPPIVQAGRRMVVPPPGMATLEQAQVFMEAGRPIRRPLEEVRVPPEAAEGQPTFPPSGLGRPEPPAFTPALEIPPTPPGQIPVGTLQPPPPPIAPPYVSGRAAQAVREMGEAQQRTSDFEKAVAEKVSQEQAEPLHPDKPLTANQLRIIKDSLVQAVTDNQIPSTKKGVIAGSEMETWADSIIKTAGQRTRMLGIDPELAAAGLVKGAAFIERGVTDFAKWSAEMLREFGERVKPHLESLFEQSKSFGQTTKLKPEDFPAAPKKTSQFIRIQTSDGNVVPAYFEGDYMHLPGSPYDGRPWVSYLNKENDWTTGILHDGDKVLDRIAAPQPPKLVAAAYVPEGATVPETGPYHPAILQRLGVQGFETAESRNTSQFGFTDETGAFLTREQSAERAKATGQDLKEFEPGEPAHSNEIESPTEPGTPISEATEESKATKGVIAGSELETWADATRERIKKEGRLRAFGDPESLAAAAIKGAAHIERGITEFARWSAEMVREFGEAIRPHLRSLYTQAQSLRAGAFKPAGAAPGTRAEPPQPGRTAAAPPAPPSPVEPGPAAVPSGEPVHGIAARVSAAAAQQGIIAPIEPGEGIAAAESVEHGRDRLNKGANPQAVLDEFNRTKAVTADGMAVVRAQGERLRKAARDAANKFGITSPQYDAAWKADSDWTAAIKPMQTEWHKIGQAQQGEVEIDTGTFHGLRAAFFEATGRDFTPAQKEAAERIAKGVKAAQDAADKAKDDALKQVAAQVGQPAQPGAATGARTTAGPAAAPGATPATRARARRGQPPVAKPLPQRVWQRARAIIDGGETDFDDVRHKLAIEFGMPVDEITRILAEPKAIRTVTDDMYRKMAERRRLVQQAKNWLKDQQAPGWYRFIRNVPRVFFIDKVFGHGTVGMITHAGLNIFNPTAWKTYWPVFLKQYKLLGVHEMKILGGPGMGAYHERMMQDLVRDPLFTRARRAGLANDPFRYQDDYQTPGMEKWLGKLGLAGNRGFDSLKLFRQARFNQLWNDLPPNLQNARYAQLLADSVNHATGVVRARFGGEWANWTFFAPKLEGSRWAWMIGDPVKAANTFVGWADATPEAREAAIAELKQKAYIAGTYLGLLALNQGILSASGSKEKVNFTNPRRSDFMAFKADGHSLGIISPMLGMVRLFANMLHASTGKRGKVESLQSRADEMGATVEQYTRGKLSPFMGFGVDLASQSDFQGRPLPFSSDTVPKYLRDRGIGKYTYGEYAAQEFTPIPISEAVREVWRAQGMNEDEITRYLDALLVGVVAGATGARISVTTPERK